MSLRLSVSALAWTTIVVMALGSFLLLGSDVTTNPKRTVTFAITVFLMIALSNTVAWIRPAARIAIGMLSIHAVATLFFMVYPTVYSALIKPRFFASERNAVGFQSGLTSHYSYNGMLLSAGLLLAIGWAWSENRERTRKSLYVSPILLVVLFGVALLATTKRGPVLAVVLAFVITSVVISGRIKTGMILKLIFGGTGLVVLLIVVAQFVPAILSIVTRLGEAVSSTSEVDATNGRSLLWRRAVDLWSQSPVVGHGWGTYRYYWEGRSDVTTQSAHNVFLNLLAEVGVLGLVVYIAAILPPLVGLWKAARNIANYELQMRPMIYFAFAYQMFYLVYSLSGSPLYDVECYLFFLIYSTGTWMALMQAAGNRHTASLRK